MKQNLKNIAIVLSAGSGSRFGADIPKQFINLAGKNIIEYTLAAFQQNPNIDEICLVADPVYHAKLQQLATTSQLTKLKKIIAGGKERQDSSYQAIQAYQHLEEANLLIHDAARPLVSQEIINACIEALENYQAVNTAIAVTDTLIEVATNPNFIGKQLNRQQIKRSQTPQVFKLSCIRQAHQLAKAATNPTSFTDDCGLIHQYLPEVPIYLVDGAEQNIKITYQQDLQLAEQILAKQQKRVLTYGTFDMFHLGHLRLLQRLKQLGTELIVGVSTDEFNAQKNKKTLIPYKQRAEIVRNIQGVSQVIAEENWEQKIADIKNYKIDVFAMGNDWQGKFDYLQDYCKVIYLPRTQDISSTLLKDLLKERFDINYE